MNLRDLSAERDGDSLYIGQFPSLEAAAERVNDETWPEGYDAILVDHLSREVYMYVDGWEKMSPATYVEREVDAMTKMAKYGREASAEADDKALALRFEKLLNLLKENCSSEVAYRFGELVESSSPRLRATHAELMEELVNLARMAIAGKTFDLYVDISTLPALPSNWEY